MRGDSLRDLYAKTLAVVGLGLLAAAGAIVDYWPVSGELPALSGVASLRNERPVVMPALPSEISAPRVIDAMHRSHESRQPRQATARVTNSFAAPFHSVRFVEPAIADEAAAFPVPELDLTALQSAWSPSLQSMVSIDLDLQPPPALIASGPTSYSRPLLTGAVSALKKTRASIREAFRGVVGTFRKVSPFWETTGTPSFR